MAPGLTVDVLDLAVRGTFGVFKTGNGRGNSGTELYIEMSRSINGTSLDILERDIKAGGGLTHGVTGIAIDGRSAVSYGSSSDTGGSDIHWWGIIGGIMAGVVVIILLAFVVSIIRKEEPRRKISYTRDESDFIREEPMGVHGDPATPKKDFKDPLFADIDDGTEAITLEVSPTAGSRIRNMGMGDTSEAIIKI